MWADNGVQVSSGTASLYDHSGSLLKTRDLRPVSPESLRILKPLRVGSSLGEYRVAADTALFRQRLAANSHQRSIAVVCAVHRRGADRLRHHRW